MKKESDYQITFFCVIGVVVFILITLILNK